MAKQLTRRQIRRLVEERYEREPVYAEQPKQKESFGFRLFMAALVIAVIVAVSFAILNLAAPLLAPIPQPAALPTAALPPTQNPAPPASSYQQPVAAPQAVPTALPVAPTAIPVSAPPEPVTAPQAGAHPQMRPTAGAFGGRRNDREAPPQLMGKPRK